MSRILNYITDRSKTGTDLIGGYGVDESNAFERMKTVKDFYNKSGGREYIHFVISFKGKKDADTVYLFAENLSSVFNDYQTLFSVHLNTQHTHVHFVINSVSYKDGHKFSQSRTDMKNLKEKINELADRWGLNAKEIIIDEYDDEEFYGYDEDLPIDYSNSYESDNMNSQLSHLIKNRENLNFQHSINNIETLKSFYLTGKCKDKNQNTCFWIDITDKSETNNSENDKKKHKNCHWIDEM